MQARRGYFPSWPRLLGRIPSWVTPVIAVAQVTALAIAGGWSAALAQGPEAGPAGGERGILLDVSVPLTEASASSLVAQLRSLGENVAGEGRRTVVMRYGADASGGSETDFESALKLARAMTSPELRRLKLVSWVEGELDGHSTLPILASDVLVVGPQGSLGDASAGESSMDETVALSYQAIAERRAVFPPAVVTALVDPGAELAQVDKVGGGQTLAAGGELQQLREEGEALREEVWSADGVPLRLDADRLRSARIAAQVIGTTDALSEHLGLAVLEPLSAAAADGEVEGVLLEIVGSISANRSRRWQANLSATLDSGETNTWLVAIDSHGGRLSESATLAGWFAQPSPPLQTVAGVIRGEARGDAALVALACKPLLMTPGSTLGGPGSEAMARREIAAQRELISLVARETRRSESLIRGLLDHESDVYRYTNRRTGRVRYATEEEIVAGAEDAELERDRWERGEQIDLADGLSAAEAVELGLADGRTDSLESAARRIGFSEIPPEASDRTIVRFVERIGRSQTLAFFLLFLGFVMLSSEASAPGVGVPGFIALLCFACFFWIKFLSGTAEWLEMMAFALGILCIGIELFVVPGFGVFGVGGLALTMLGVVLMSQTFVVPRNAYQLEILTRGIWTALGSAGGLILGVVLIRAMLPHVPLFRGLVMETPDAVMTDTKERLTDFAHLEGCEGVTTTPLRPSGKARFEEQIVGVVSDGTAIGSGESIRVTEVHGNRIVVERMES